MMVGTNLKDTQLQQIVDKTILQLVMIPPAAMAKSRADKKRVVDII